MNRLRVSGHEPADRRLVCSHRRSRWRAKLKLQRRGNHGESEIDGAVTVRERDLITDRIPIDFVNQSSSRSPGHIISDMGMSATKDLPRLQGRWSDDFDE